MTRIFRHAVLLLACATGLAQAELRKPAEEASCGDFGTSVRFAKSPSEAARQALKEEKLVFVLHISGYFEESEFT